MGVSLRDTLAWLEENNSSSNKVISKFRVLNFHIYVKQNMEIDQN